MTSKMIIKNFFMLCFFCFSASVYAYKDISKTNLPDDASIKSNLSKIGVKNINRQKAMMLEKWTGDLKNSEDDTWSIQTGWDKSTKDLYKRMITKYSTNKKVAAIIINVCNVYARDSKHCAVFLGSIGCSESSCAASNRVPFFYKQQKTYNFVGFRGDTGGDISIFPSFASTAKCWVASTTESPRKSFCAPYTKIAKETYNTNWYKADEGTFYGYCKTQFSPTTISENHYRDIYCYKDTSKKAKTRGFYTDIPGLYSAYNYCTHEDGHSEGTCPNGLARSSEAYDTFIKGLK